MLHFFQMGPFKVLTFFSRFKTLGSSHHWICYIPASSGDTTPNQHCDFDPGLLQLVYFLCATWPIWPLLLMQLSCLTLFFKPFILLPTLYLSLLYPNHWLMLLVFFCTSCFLFPSWLSQGSSMECWRSPSQKH